MELRYSTIIEMLNLIKMRNQGKNIDNELIHLLSHPDYDEQFKFYANHPAGIKFDADDFIEMFNSIELYVPKEGVSKALLMRRGDLHSVFQNITFFESKFQELKLISVEDLENALTNANAGLVYPIRKDDIELIIAIGVGVTGGFNNNYVNFFDFVKSFSGKTKQGFLNTVSHELHHKGFKEQFDIDYSNHRLVDVFIHFFAGEGMAIKFCNNFEGMLTKKIRNGEHTHIIESYEYYMNNYDEIIKLFLKDLNDIYNRKYKTIDQIECLFDDHYYYRDVIIEGKKHEFYLKNPIAYYLGADVWGLLYDNLSHQEYFGFLLKPEGLYEILKPTLKNTVKCDTVNRTISKHKIIACIS